MRHALPNSTLSVINTNKRLKKILKMSNQNKVPKYLYNTALVLKDMFMNKNSLNKFIILILLVHLE